MFDTTISQPALYIYIPPSQGHYAHARVGSCAVGRGERDDRAWVQDGAVGVVGKGGRRDIGRVGLGGKSW